MRLIVCGDFNVNFNDDTPHRSLISLLATFGLYGTVDFPTRIDNIFVNSIKQNSINVYPWINPYPTAFPYGNGMVLHFYQQQESSTTKTVHKVINKGLKAYI